MFRYVSSTLRRAEIQQEIQKESAKYIRHSIRNGTAPVSAKDGQIPQKIKEDYAQIDRLAEEKVKLAQRVVALIQRAKARLDYDLGKVLVLQGDLDPSQQSSFVMGRNPVQQINESLRNAMALPEALPSATPTPTPAVSLPKRRRIAAGASAAAIKLPSPAPVSLQVPAQRSRTSSHRPSPARGRRAVSSLGPDEDAEGEEDIEEAGEEGEDNEDKSLYCFCQKMSYGEMVACDNPDCAYQWFHLPCVNLKPPLPEVWYCSDCVAKGRAGSYAGGTVSERSRKRKR
ncbi:hypothetical protein EW146_g7440 [Bondarzewia mesenterica]|uniref:Chromatin modification-related protein n=1 Tax=Bondarzewia mesenterica TaxID=1095465 RepID=A0A4S4LMN2_9AGAM|nr:hypothetical protein EW146_g7440 [Bondarzewia mesenterica]